MDWRTNEDDVIFPMLQLSLRAFEVSLFIFLLSVENIKVSLYYGPCQRQLQLGPVDSYVLNPIQVVVSSSFHTSEELNGCNAHMPASQC